MVHTTLLNYYSIKVKCNEKSVAGPYFCPSESGAVAEWVPGQILKLVLADEEVLFLAVVIVGAVGALAEESHALAGTAGHFLVPGVLAHVDWHARLQ